MRACILLLCFLLGGCLVVETYDYPSYYAGRRSGYVYVRPYVYEQPRRYYRAPYYDDRRWLRNYEGRRYYRRPYYDD